MADLHCVRKDDEQVSTQLCRHLQVQGCPVPVIRPLRRRERFLAAALRALVRVLAPFASKQRTQVLPGCPRSSTWGVWSHLNLRGAASCESTSWEHSSTREESSQKRAVRFGHVLPLSASQLQTRSLDVLCEAVARALCPPLSFPWRTRDDGLQASTELPFVPTLERARELLVRLTLSSSSLAESLPQEKVVILQCPKSHFSTQEAEFLRQLLWRNMLVILFGPYDEDTVDDVGFLHLLLNHEYLDGVPAAYLAKTIATQLDLSPLELSFQPLREFLQRADAREHLGHSASSYCVHSLVYSADALRALEDAYQYLLSLLKQRESAERGLGFLSRAKFLQLLLFDFAQVHPTLIRGGILKFDPHLDTQLSHYSYSFSLSMLVEACLQNASEALRQMLCPYEPKRENVGSVIGVIRHFFPRWLWRPINQFALWSGITKGIAGQVLCSVLPIGWELGTERLCGYGSPAMMMTQDAAYTITFQTNAQHQFSELVIRYKYREPSTA